MYARPNKSGSKFPKVEESIGKYNLLKIAIDRSLNLLTYSVTSELDEQTMYATSVCNISVWKWCPFATLHNPYLFLLYTVCIFAALIRLACPKGIPSGSAWLGNRLKII